LFWQYSSLLHFFFPPQLPSESTRIATNYWSCRLISEATLFRPVYILHEQCRTTNADNEHPWIHTLFTARFCRPCTRNRGIHNQMEEDE
jgi:hypothetical protein